MRLLVAVGLVLLLAPAPPRPLPSEVPLSHDEVTPVIHLAALDVPPGIRPGGWIMVNGSNCTAAFVVEDSLGALYITTASHCVDVEGGGVGSRASFKEGGLVGALTPMYEFGTVVATDIFVDTALIRVDEAHRAKVNASMAGWGGPTGLLTEIPAEPVGVRWHGWGWFAWAAPATRCRQGVANPADPLFPWTDRRYFFHGAVGNGDSGAAVMTEDGLALGTLAGSNIFVPAGPQGFVGLINGGRRFDVALQVLEGLTGLDLALKAGEPVRDRCPPTSAGP